MNSIIKKLALKVGSNPVEHSLKEYERIYHDSIAATTDLQTAAKKIDQMINQYQAAWTFFVKGYTQIKDSKSPLLSDYFLLIEYTGFLSVLKDGGQSI
jgi:exonuclease VII small subunit